MVEEVRCYKQYKTHPKTHAYVWIQRRCQLLLTLLALLPRYTIYVALILANKHFDSHTKHHVTDSALENIASKNVRLSTNLKSIIKKIHKAEFSNVTQRASILVPYDAFKVCKALRLKERIYCLQLPTRMMRTEPFLKQTPHLCLLQIIHKRMVWLKGILLSCKGIKGLV